MSSQSIVELDPLFEKALKLLRSKSKESGAQLKQLLDNYLAKYKTDDHEPEKLKSSKSSSSLRSEEEKQKRDPEKRSYDKLKQDLPEQSQESKRPRLDSPTIKEEKSHKEKEEKSHREKDGKDKERDREKDKDRHRKDKEHRDKDRDKDREKKDKDREKDKQREREKEKQREKEREKEKKEKQEREKMKEKEKERERLKEKKKEKERSDKSSEETTDDEAKTDDMDADDFAFGLGIACVVCRGIDVTLANKLVECQECHSLYHQECHKPVVTEQDVNDPRSVWYCTKCMKTMKKLVTKPAQKQKSSTSVSQPPPKDISNNSVKPVKTESTANVLPFRRIEAKVSAKETTVSSSTKPLSGLASLAANLSGKTSVEPLEKGKSLLKSQSTTQQSASGSLAMATADKRLQMMKKKAAQKQMEKKSLK